MNNRKQYHIDITFDFDNTDDLGKRLGEIVREIYARSLTGEFEEPEVGLGWNIEINSNACYFEDGYIKGRIGDEVINWKN